MAQFFVKDFADPYNPVNAYPTLETARKHAQHFIAEFPIRGGTPPDFQIWFGEDGSGPNDEGVEVYPIEEEE